MVGPSMVCGVHARRTVPAPLFQRAMSRHGIVHHRELEDAGVTKSVRARLIMDGTLQRLTRGLYSVQPPTARTWALAGAFIAGPKAAIGGWHALEAHGMATFSPLGIQPVSPTHITIWTPADEHRSPTASAPDVRWLFRRDKFNRLDRATEVRRLIDRHDAVLDVCEELQTSEVIALITRIHQERLADPVRLAALLDERSRHAHRRLLADMSATPHSECIRHSNTTTPLMWNEDMGFPLRNARWWWEPARPTLGTRNTSWPSSWTAGVTIATESVTTGVSTTSVRLSASRPDASAGTTSPMTPAVRPE